jgi:uncharacterized protein YbjT (DUF2867 family)
MIVQATQFFEFMGPIAQSATGDGSIRLSTALMQPIASGDVAEALADVALERPLNATIELAGPERIRMPEAVQRYLQAVNDPRSVVADPRAPYFGMPLDDRSLMPGEGARLGSTRYAQWLAGLAKVA